MMIAPLLTALLLLAQPAPAQPVAAQPEPAAKPAQAPPPPSARLDATLTALKGKPTAAFTSKLGPAGSIKQATDGQVLFWTINLPGETVCGGGADGALTCQRQGGGDCLIAAAFKSDGLMSAFRSAGVPAACDKAADQLKPAG